MRISDWSADGFAADLHLRLDDRHDAGFLAQRRITGQRMRVGLDAIVTRNAIADRDDGAPLREARTGFAILHEPFAQAVEAFGDRLARRARQLLGALVDLYARQHALGAPPLRKRDRKPDGSGKSVS